MALQTVPLFGVPMGPEVIVILLIAILLFGANKIPKLARSTGQALGEFEKGKEQAEQELQQIKETGGTGGDAGAQQPAGGQAAGGQPATGGAQGNQPQGANQQPQGQNTPNEPATGVDERTRE